MSSISQEWRHIRVLVDPVIVDSVTRSKRIKRKRILHLYSIAKLIAKWRKGEKGFSIFKDCQDIPK